MRILHFCVCLFLVVSIIACDSNNNKLENISDYNKSESHNMGKICQNCHISGGKGKGWFQIAGTVYDSLNLNTISGGLVVLYDKPNGEGNIVGSIKVDKNGNFYSTEDIDFSKGLYPTIKDINGIIKYMPNATKNGACNSCHTGNLTRRIWVSN